MRRFWLFRSNIRDLEYYHNFNDLETFENRCHDFYLLMGLWFLKHDIFDEVIVWRIAHKQLPDIVFETNGKKFIQKFCLSFDECLRYPKPMISLFRGGFQEYDNTIKKDPGKFGIKLYLAAGKRIYPKDEKLYDKVLIESEEDNRGNDIRFYKTCNPNIFRPYEELKKIYDLCWICNNTQIRHKGQEFFISSIGNSDYLKQLKIIHIGNKPEVGLELCKKYGVNNIRFVGPVERYDINVFLNLSKFGIMTSNKEDGCPRISTEILCSGTPLIIRNQTRLLNFYKKCGVCVFDDKSLKVTVENAMKYYNQIKKDLDNYKSMFSMDIICGMNITSWGYINEKNKDSNYRMD
jgi:hypothetical protein